MHVSVDGHVGHGLKEAKAKDLSLRRSKMVCHKLHDMGVPEDHLRAQGFGNSRTRFPKGHPKASHNRRVEFHILSGNGQLAAMKK